MCIIARFFILGVDPRKGLVAVPGHIFMFALHGRAQYSVSGDRSL